MPPFAGARVESRVAEIADANARRRRDHFALMDAVLAFARVRRALLLPVLAPNDAMRHLSCDRCDVM